MLVLMVTQMQHIEDNNGYGTPNGAVKRSSAIEEEAMISIVPTNVSLILKLEPDVHSTPQRADMISLLTDLTLWRDGECARR